jgi:hypothetical protein
VSACLLGVADHEEAGAGAEPWLGALPVQVGLERGLTEVQSQNTMACQSDQSGMYIR